MQRLLSFTCILLCCWLAAADLTLEVLDPTYAYQTGARCLDGSPASFHFEQGAETKKWVIYVEGGGSCDTEKACKSRSLTALGSSLHQAYIITTDSVASNDPIGNPGFWNWTHVRMDYCSGDRWAGTRVNASVDSWGFYFAGHAIFKAIIDHLVTKYRLDLATDILVHGGSAGAYGAMTNIDYVNKKLMRPTISLAMNSGWATDFYPPWSGDGVDGELQVAVQLYQSYINQACAANNANNLTACFFPRYIFPYIPNRVFVLNSLLDKVELATLGFPDSAIFAPNGSNYLVALGNYAKLSILTEYTRDPKVDGLFITTCPYHGIDMAIQGTLPNVAEAFWYYRPKSSSTPAVNYDNCAIDSVVSLLKANTSLYDDCPRLMQLCTKNTNSGTPNVFEQVFNSAAAVVEGSDSPVAAVTNEPVDNDTASTGSVVNSLTIMAVIMITAGLL